MLGFLVKAWQYRRLIGLALAVVSVVGLALHIKSAFDERDLLRMQTEEQSRTILQIAKDRDAKLAALERESIETARRIAEQNEVLDEIQNLDKGGACPVSDGLRFAVERVLGKPEKATAR